MWQLSPLAPRDRWRLKPVSLFFCKMTVVKKCSSVIEKGKEIVKVWLRGVDMQVETISNQIRDWCTYCNSSHFQKSLWCFHSIPVSFYSFIN